MQLPRPGPPPTPPNRGRGQPESGTDARPHGGSGSREDVPANSDAEEEAEAGLREDVQPHDTRRRRLRLRLSVGTQEAIRSFAEAHGISEAGLLDALFHGLETADESWLDAVTEHARRMDAHYRSDRTPEPGSGETERG